jgi:hypothetical protein
MHQGGIAMIGTNSSFRWLAAFVKLALACGGIGLVWGCDDAPLSFRGGDKTVARNVIPVPNGHKPDVVTTVGLVEEIDHVTMRLRVSGLWFFADFETEIEIQERKPCPFADIQAGDPAKVKHDRVPTLDGAYYAREVEIEHDDDDERPEDPEDDEAETEGVVETTDGNRLLVTGVWFWLDGATELETDGRCAIDIIVAGDRVKIEHSTAETDGLGYYAWKIEIECGCDEDEEYLEG